MLSKITTSLLFAVLSCSLVVACSSSDDASATPSGTGGSGGTAGSAGSGGAGGMGGTGMPQMVAPSAETKAVWSTISGYQTWPTFPESSAPKMSDSHMKMYVLAHHNDVVGQAIADKTLPLPDGSIIVKDNFAKADDSMPMAVTVMSKQGGKWYWIEASPDGMVMVDQMMDVGAPLEGNDVKMCVGCHVSWKDNDYVGTHVFK